MKQIRLNITFVILVSLVVTTLLAISPAQAQDEVCYFDPFPLEAPSREVPCDSPDCNSGPCEKEVEQLTIEERKENWEEVKRENKEVRREEVGERRAALAEGVQNRIINLASNIVSRLEGAIERFENIFGRIDSRIVKLEDMGVDTDAATIKLEEAKVSVNTVKSMLGDLDSVHDAVSGDSPREAFTQIKTDIRVIRDLLKQAHGEIKETVTLLKEAVRDAELGRGVSGAVSNKNDVRSTEDIDEENPE